MRKSFLNQINPFIFFIFARKDAKSRRVNVILISIPNIRKSEYHYLFFSRKDAKSRKFNFFRINVPNIRTSENQFLFFFSQRRQVAKVKFLFESMFRISEYQNIRISIYQFFFFLHLSLQYTTSCQFFSHFLRHEKGSWQVLQIFSGRFTFLCAISKHRFTFLFWSCIFKTVN